MKKLFKGSIRTVTFIIFASTILCCSGGSQHQNPDRPRHDGGLAEDRFTDRYGSGFETGETTKNKNTGEECTERILQCFSRIGEDNLNEVPDRLLSSLENVDKMKALWIAARIEPEKRSLIIRIAEEGLTISNIKTICGILSECLGEGEMNQVAALAEKYTGIILQAE